MATKNLLAVGEEGDSRAKQFGFSQNLICDLRPMAEELLVRVEIYTFEPHQN